MSMMDEMTGSTNGADATAAMAQELVASGALDGLFSRIDSGEVQLTGDGGMLQLFSRPATGRQPKDIAAELVSSTYPDAKTAYEVPNAMVGYQSGYGIVADWYPQGASRQYTRMRLLVLVAVKNDLALIAAASGPYHRFGPDFGSGKPSAVGLQLALDMGQYVNSFAWRGDPAR